MAEAISDEDTSPEVTSELSTTDCAICFKPLRTPKSLPCLHTFCQDCLSTFITNHNTSEASNVFFNCPVCRRQTQPIEPSSTPDLWASQFPTNNFVEEMMKKLNSDDTNKHLCHLCLKRDNNETPAICWCQDCGDFLCESCSKGHQLVLFNHKTISIQELSNICSVLIPVQSKCDKHCKNLEFICLDHILLCCYVCIAIDHRKCDNVSTKTEFAGSLKSKGNITEDIDKNVREIDYVITKFRENLNVITKDKDTALKTLAEIRKWFDCQMYRMSDKVMKAYNVETEKIHTTLKDMETVRASLLQTKAMSNTTKQNGNELQLVSTVLKGKSEMGRCEQIVQNNQHETIRIHLKQNDEFENLTTEKYDICTVEVNKETNDSGHNLRTKPLFGREAKQVGTITVPGSDQYIKGLLVLTNGHLLVSDNSGKQLMLITESGKVLSTLGLDGRPWDICQMPNEDIAVSVPSSKKIIIVRLSSSQLSMIRNMQLTELPYGIIFYDGALHVTTNENRLYRISDGDKLEQIRQFNEFSFYLTCCKSGSQLIGSLYENDQANSAVYRVSRDNTYREVIKADIVKQAGGIDVDDEDNIYVCGRQSNNVLQISADGARTKELVTSQDVFIPFLLNVRGDKMYICEDGKRIIRIYLLE